MSDKPNDPKRTEGDDEVEMLALLTDAFSEAGGTIPTTEAEVARAEARGAAWQGPLPERLAAPRPVASPPATEEPPHNLDAAVGRDPPSPDEGGRVVPIDRARRARPTSGGLATHTLAVALGAAAAAAFFVLRDRPRGGGRTDALPSGDIVASPREDAAPPARRITVEVPQDCPESQCCAGPRCEAAKGDLKACPSGRTCVSCSVQDTARSRYRLKMGSVTLSEAGTRILDADPQGAFEMCFRAGSSEVACVLTPENANGKEPWIPLPFVVSGQDLSIGLEATLRRRGTTQPLARLRAPIPLNATVLCRGLSLKLATTKEEEVLATVFMVLADTHYVELMRGGSVDALLAHEGRLDLRGTTPQIYETARDSAERFALVLGPFDVSMAENVRWSLLDQGEAARITVGADHVGQPRKAR